MKKQKILIHIFSFPNGIDALERTLILLKQNLVNVDKSKFYLILDITLTLSNYFIDWENSILKQDYFEDKFKKLEIYGDDFDEINYNIDYDSEGALKYTIGKIYQYNDIDNMIWLDTDIVFNQYTLGYILESTIQLNKHHSKYILTPECVKMWDSSWDVLVNYNFLDKPNNPLYVLVNDPIVDSASLYGEVNLEPLVYNNQKIFKFGGGWFTVFSKELLDFIEFPRDTVGYCAIDTYIMDFCKYIPDAIQYKIKNLVICEDRKYNETVYSSYVKNIDRKFSSYQSNWDKLVNHMQNKLNDISKFK
jgi:hypothetical protein